MAYVFVSHASEDKPRVRPLVRALALEGMQLWLDRPGYGKSHFNFDRNFISRYHIRELETGKPWPAQLSIALKEASAVLLCLSKSLCKERLVLANEIAIAGHSGKLTACILDDLSETDLPRDLGLVDLSKIQTERIDPELLNRATADVESGRNPNALAPELKAQWEHIWKLKADIRKIFEELGVDNVTPLELKQATEILARYPIGPAVNFYDIPTELVELFADRFDKPERAKRLVALARQLIKQCNPEGFTDKQILVSDAEVVYPTLASSLEYWSQIFSMSGMKSRRTLAALFVAPGAPRASLNPILAKRYDGFLQWLEDPTGCHAD